MHSRQCDRLAACYLDWEHVDSSAEHKKAALFCAPGLKADANTLQNHNHLHSNSLPFLGHKKWEAVHDWREGPFTFGCAFGFTMTSLEAKQW